MAVTKSHKTSQPHKLSTKQLNAIDQLLLGRSDRQTAEEVGVSRETITRWRNQNSHFIAELNRQRKTLWHADHDRLRGLADKALDTLEQAIEGGDVKAAIEVLKAVKLYGNVEAPTGAIDPDVVMRQQAAEWAQRECERQSLPVYARNAVSTMPYFVETIEPNYSPEYRELKLKRLEELRREQT